MKFERLRLVGFKSFCDTTELVLEPGLTGVVGPNGCGKSNLVEAMRWVMGESSYKAMRASGMDDVIFSGSANRPGRNTAEVTLVLDNSDRTAPAPLNTADTLEVTRRIERENGSVYRVNGREVRARDVQLLFADASTGAHSPALVRQGQIGELIAAKPVKRRALLEEAAGISGLHSRRHEAELRLRAAEQNLERVDDVIAQIEQQLETLKRQARLATRYRGLSGEIRKAEATLFHLRWVASRYAEKEAEAEQGQLINKLAEATHVETEATKLNEQMEARIQPLRQAEAEAGAVLQRLTILRDQLDDEMRRSSARRRELEDRQVQIKTDMEREQALVEESTGALERYQGELQSLTDEEANEAASAETARNEVAQIKEKVEGAEIAARQSSEALAQTRAQRNQAQNRAQEAKSRADRLTAQLADVEKSQAEVEANIGADEAVASRRQALSAAQSRAETAEAATLASEKATADQQAALEAARPELTVLESQVSRLDAEADTLAKVLNVEGGSLWPAIVDALDVTTGYETALGAALGDDLEASSDSGAPLYWSEPGDGNGDATLPEGVTPLSRFVKAPDILNRRLNQIGLVEKVEGASLMKQLRPGQRLVSIEGDLWRWDGFIAAADAPTAAAQRLAQRNRLAELDAEIASARAAHAAKKDELAALSESLAATRATEKEHREQWRAAQHDISRAQADLELAQKALEDLGRRQSALAEAKTQLQSNLDEARQSAEAAEAELGALGDDSATEAALAQQQTELSSLRDQFEQARLKLGGFENAARLRQSRRQQIENEVNGWTRRQESASAQMQTLSQRGEDIAAQLKALDETPDGFGDRKAALETQIEDASEAHRSASDTLARADTDRRDADKAARLAGEARTAVRESLARVEERIKGVITQRQQIEHMCTEALSIPANKTAEVAGLKPDAPLPREEDMERKVERLKAERERLGGVNLGAEREAEEIKEKLETMITDRDDLIAAIAKLRSGIASLNREGRARLTEAFDKVNAHFRELFTTLFGGGEAQLTFVESDDPLEAGLEIIARPPGKKPQTMTLLSGGEQALTALSLIFAVFLTNPAPICVLDEVDAPLDDANVERFCTLLDSMRNKTETRFVVITHNPITMSRVDRLFGVTMAERGVSQLVSVDLTTAHAVAEAS